MKGKVYVLIFRVTRGKEEGSGASRENEYEYNYRKQFNLNKFNCGQGKKQLKWTPRPNYIHKITKSGSYHSQMSPVHYSK